MRVDCGREIVGRAPSILPRFCKLGEEADEEAFNDAEVIGSRIGMVDVAIDAIRPVTWPTSLSSNYVCRSLVSKAWNQYQRHVHGTS